jgi:hypothetical protein
MSKLKTNPPTEKEINLTIIKSQLYNSIFLADIGINQDLDKLDLRALLLGISAILDKTILQVTEMENTK